MILTAIVGAVGPAQPATDPAPLEAVRALYEAGEFARAAKLAETARPRSADLAIYQGLALGRLGDLDNARSALLAGYEEYPNDARFAEELAGIAYRRKSALEAKRWLEKALSRDPESHYANDFLGLLFLADNNLPAALKYWNRIGKPLVREVRLDPAPPLHPLLLDRALTASPGQVLSTNQLQTMESNLDRLGALGDYNLALSQRQDQQFDLTLRSAGTAGNLGGWAGRLLPYLRGLPYETVCLDFANIRQKAAVLSSLARWDSNKRRIAISLAGPFRLNPRWSYRLGVDARDEIWDLSATYFGKPGGLNRLNLRKIEAGGEFEYGLTGRLDWTTGLSVAKRSFQNQDQQSFFTNGWSAQFRNGLKYLLWDWPEHRVRVNASVHLDTGRILTGAPGKEVVAGGALSAKWLPPAQGEDLAIKLNLSGASIFGTAPFDDYFMLGMERDNDDSLWMRGHVGTRDGRKGSAPMGTRYFLLQSEIDRTVFKLPFVRIQLGPFLDVGRIGASTPDFGSHGYMTDSGLQAKIKTLGSLTLRLVYGRDLRQGRGVFYTAITK